MNNSNKLQAKDLVNVGIYSAIYLVITCVLSFLSLIPIFHPLLAVICPIAGGIPFMLFLTKAKKFGMITIMGIIMGIVMLLTGMGYFCLFTGPISAVVADLVAKSGKYISAKKSVLTCGIFSLWYIGNYLAVFITREAQYQHTIDGYGQAYADAYIAIYQYWMLPVLIAVCFVSGLLGGVLGKKILKKHFQKAGIV
ncbi:MAG: MptD family putative ECF transporter S component [Eubacterium sp.]|nr:MptD family putative ECF transporter S component [Eubacterium sp.]